MHIFILTMGAPDKMIRETVLSFAPGVEINDDAIMLRTTAGFQSSSKDFVRSATVHMFSPPHVQI